MRVYTRLFLIVSLFAVTGCSGYQLEPLSIIHPAHPEATAAPTRYGPQTLDYRTADLPAPTTVAAMSQMGHGAHESVGHSQLSVEGRGRVVATVPDASQLVIEHGNIQGFMEAMTMGYRIDPPELLHGLKIGDQVKFTIDVQKKTIVKIEKLNP